MALPTTAYALATAQSSPGATVADFSLFVDLSLLPSTWWDEVSSSDGTRGRVALDDETELACCWIDFNDTAETGYVWFQITGNITSSDTPAVRIYPPQTGNTTVAASDTYGSNNAFNSNWRGFWPLSDLTDRTSNGIALTANNTPTSGAAGKFGDCYQFDGASSEYLSANISSANIGNRTLIAWARATSTTGGGANTAAAIGSSASDYFLHLAYAAFLGNVWTGRYSDGSGTRQDNLAATPSGATWYHLATSMDLTANTIEFFLDGAGNGTAANDRLDRAVNRFSIGAVIASGTATTFWNGYIAWVQDHAVQRSTAWIAYDYTISNDNSTFWGSWTLENNSTPIVPGVLRVTSRSTSSISLTCTAASGGDDTLNYQLQRSANTGAALSWSNIGSSGTGTTFTDSTVSANSPYLYRVAVTDGVQTEYTATVAGDSINPLAIQPPLYGGKPNISGLSSITPKIICNRMTANIPAAINFSACESTFNAGAYADFDYRWDFGDASGTESMTDHLDGSTVNPNASQRGPEAAYVYRTSGSFTVTLTITGRDANGLAIVASTTTLNVPAKWGVFLGDATGGDFTLTYGGNTTAAIAYNATDTAKDAALHALPVLDSTNCSVKAGSVWFFGNLSGVSTALTGTFSGLTGGTPSSSAPAVREDVAAATGASLTISDLSAWSAVYVDPDYDGGNGASNGTQSRPYTAWSSLETHIEGGNNRVVYLKRGTSITATGKLSFLFYSGQRLLPYGTGAKPIITGLTSYFEWSFRYGSTGNENIAIGDTVISNMDLRSGSDAGACVTLDVSSNGDANKSYAACKPVCLDSITWTTTSTTATLFANFVGYALNGSPGIQGTVIWDCDIDHAGAESQGIYIAQRQFAAIIGGSIAGGDGSSTLDHHIYNVVVENSCTRYVDGQAATSKGFFSNNNATSDIAIPSRFHWFQGNNISGCQNGLDFSNSNNNGTEGYYTLVGVEGNRVNSGKILTQEFGIFAWNLDDITIRDNLFWDNGDGNIEVKNNFQTCDFSIYRNRCYGAVLIDVDTNSGYMHDNIVYNAFSEACITYDADATIDTWSVQGNQYYAPGATQPFQNSTSSAYESFATWQSDGRDIYGSVADPGWFDPANGDFSQDGPGGSGSAANLLLMGVG